MSGEQLAILRMLGEGKITAEEAQRLLEALGDEATRLRRQPWGSAAEWSRRQSRLWDVDDPFREALDVGPQVIPVAQGATLWIEGVTGAIRLVGTDADALTVEGASPQHYQANG